MISASLSPNTQPDDVYLAIKILFSPWRWYDQKSLRQVVDWFSRFYQEKITLFSSGRVAMLALLEAFGIGKGDEVLVQAFTCVAVPNSVIWRGATPIYADIDDRYNIDPKQLEKHITTKTKAIIVQHTFGIPAAIEVIVSIAHKYHLLVIEDCAHSLGVTHNGKLLGTFGDAAFFSFGRDKVVSSVWGGGAIINTHQKTHITKLNEIEKKLPEASFFWILQQLLHPIAFSVILPLYDVMIGKFFLILLQKLHLLSLPIYKKELIGERPPQLLKKFPGALGILLIHQLRKLPKYTRIRRANTQRYFQALQSITGLTLPPFQKSVSYLRFPLFVQNPTKIRLYAKKKGILLGNWYSHVIDPGTVDYKKIFYSMGIAKNAETAARTVINIPTLLSSREVEKVISVIKGVIK